MHRRLMARLTFETPSKHKHFKDLLEDKLNRMDCYDRDVTHGEDMGGKPQTAIDVRPHSRAEADDLFEWLKDQMEMMATKDEVTAHDCSHDQPAPRPCKVDERYVK